MSNQNIYYSLFNSAKSMQSSSPLINSLIMLIIILLIPILAVLLAGTLLIFWAIAKVKSVVGYGKTKIREPRITIIKEPSSKDYRNAEYVDYEEVNSPK